MITQFQTQKCDQPANQPTKRGLTYSCDTNENTRRESGDIYIDCVYEHYRTNMIKLRKSNEVDNSIELID